MKCNFGPLGLMTKYDLVSKAFSPLSQSIHDLSTLEYKLNDNCSLGDDVPSLRVQCTKKQEDKN
jgi:hypothetical protein